MRYLELSDGVGYMGEDDADPDFVPMKVLPKPFPGYKVLN
jgi:hypothetical protein